MGQVVAPSDAASLLSEVDARLAVALPEPVCELDHDDAWQLLVVTILSAKARDAVINEIRPVLFERWPGPVELAAADPEQVEPVIRRSGTYRTKARAIVGCAKAIVEHHGGQVPASYEQLVALSGVSHKTANLVLGIAFGEASGIVVDTHVARVAERLGLVAAGRNPKQVERRLTGLIARERWIAMSHELILHGRHLCRARAPSCPACALHELCPSRRGEPEGDWKERAEAEGQLFAVRGDQSRLVDAPAPAPARPAAANDDDHHEAEDDF